MNLLGTIENLNEDHCMDSRELFIFCGLSMLGDIGDDNEVEMFNEEVRNLVVGFNEFLGENDSEIINVLFVHEGNVYSLPEALFLQDDGADEVDLIDETFPDGFPEQSALIFFTNAHGIDDDAFSYLTDEHIGVGVKVVFHDGEDWQCGIYEDGEREDDLVLAANDKDLNDVMAVTARYIRE